MITRRMKDKLEELKSYFNTKFNKQKQSLTKKGLSYTDRITSKKC